jgi:SpoVK/Ycf46/Vps4 family AAA+-type ATPase
VLVIGATNRPQELDEAARRRFTKRVYIPLPDADARRGMVQHLLSQNPHKLSSAELETIVARSDGYSGADITNLCKEASMHALRSALPMTGATAMSRASRDAIKAVRKEDVPPIGMPDFKRAFQTVKPSVAASELTPYETWNRQFGSSAGAAEASEDVEGHDADGDIEMGAGGGGDADDGPDGATGGAAAMAADGGAGRGGRRVD